MKTLTPCALRLTPLLLRSAINSLLLSTCLSLPAATTALTYSGRLARNGGALTGLFDFRFALYDAVTNGALIAGPLTNPAVHVTNALFIATLDFGAAPFTGADRWLDIAVRPHGKGPFADLSPRQALSPVPLAVYSETAAAAAAYAGAVSPAQLTGPIPPALLPPNLLTNNAAAVTLAGSFSGAVAGSGAGLTNTPWSPSRSALLAAAAAGQYQTLRLLYDPNGTPTNAAVLWPDGTYGVWTATNINAAWLTVDGYTLTYTNAGKTIAQPAVARDQNGNVTNSPALIIAP